MVVHKVRTKTGRTAKSKPFKPKKSTSHKRRKKSK